MSAKRGQQLKSKKFYLEKAAQAYCNSINPVQILTRP